MKLYAKTTSERASKGQGGNKYINIEITAEGFEGIPTRSNLYRLSISKNDDSGGLYAEIMKYSNHEIIVLDNIKGKKWQDVDIQTGELIDRHEKVKIKKPKV